MERRSPFQAPWRVSHLVFQAVFVAGIVAALAGWRPGVVLIVAGAGGLVVAHVLIAVAAYRRIMRAPWPKVRPLADDDDW